MNNGTFEERLASLEEEVAKLKGRIEAIPPTPPEEDPWERVYGSDAFGPGVPRITATKVATPRQTKIATSQTCDKVWQEVGRHGDIHGRSPRGCSGKWRRRESNPRPEVPWYLLLRV